MEVTVSMDKLDEYVIDDKHKMHAPKHFFEEAMLEISRTIFLTLAKYCLESEINVLPGRRFHDLLDKCGVDFDRQTIKGILELQSKGYLKVEI